MSTSPLEALRALQRERGHGPLFSTHLDFQNWVDQVAPLLSFDAAAKASFLHCARSADVSHNLGSTNDSYSSISRAVGIVNQAVRTLELQVQESSPAIAATSTPENLKLPEKVTIKWLYEHAPIAFYVWFAGLLAAAFTLGLLASETPLYALIKSSVASSPKATAAPASGAQ
jgi:hypothetical protein